MSILIDLPTATEEKLRAFATTTGKNVESLVVEAVETKLGLSQIGLREILQPVHQDFKASGMTDQELDELFRETLAEVRAAKKTKPGQPS